MKRPNSLKRAFYRSALIAVIGGGFLTGVNYWSHPNVSANHPVLVEGEKDFDGDGLVGLAEDTDNVTDRVFGTINAALGAANGGAAQNGRVTIVTSGRFREIVVITGASGNVTLEGAAGVEANIDAVIAGDRSSQFPGTTNATAQAAPGIVVNAPANRSVTIRNIVIRNWTDGIRILSESRVAVDNVRAEGNVNNGIDVSGTARVTITNSHINFTGFRVGATGDFPSPVNQPDPGHGISFEGDSRGTVVSTTINGSFGAGISNVTGNPAAVRLLLVNAFDNNPNFIGVKPPPGTTPGVVLSALPAPLPKL